MRLTLELKRKVISILKKENYIDFITISSWLLFQGKYLFSIEELEKSAFYNNVRKTAIEKKNYLKGVIRCSYDFKLFFKNEIYGAKTVFLLDPPYIMTLQSGYSTLNIFNLRCLIYLLKNVHKNPFILFSNSKELILFLLNFYPVKTLKIIEKNVLTKGNKKAPECMFVANF